MSGKVIPKQALKKEPSKKALNLNGGTDEARLGFAPRSNSLVYEPTVLTNSIFSLSGLALCASSVRKSAELAFGLILVSIYLTK